MGMTIKQLANQLGVSKTTISKAISALGLSNRLNRSGNKYIISDEQTEQIKMYPINFEKRVICHFFSRIILKIYFISALDSSAGVCTTVSVNHPPYDS